jgi:putative ABC transport system permease protein
MPDWEQEIRNRLAGVEVGRRDDIVQELAQHLQDRYTELVDDGVGHAEAFELALDELSAAHVLGRALSRVEPPPQRAVPPIGMPAKEPWLTGWWADVRDASRSLRGNPGVTLIALATLAIAIGGNAAIFSVVNAAILRPLPFTEPERLVSFWGSAPKMGLPVVNFPDALYVHFRTRARTMESVAAYQPASLTLTGNGDAERVSGAYVTANFLATLGRTPARGRDFRADEEAPGRATVALLSDGFWRRRFGAAPDIVGRAIVVEGNSITIVGVMPPGFDFPDRANLWMPIPTDPQSQNCWCYDTIGRLARGQTAATAAREIAFLNDDFSREGATQPVSAVSPAEPKSIVIAEPLARTLVGDDRLPLLVLLGAVGIALLIACANIANLLLARGNARRHEVAVRCALGASPWRIVRQLLVESLLLGSLGAAIGLVLAAAAVRLVEPSVVDRLSYVSTVALDGPVLAFTTMLTVLTVMLFGVAPAIRSARIDLQHAVRDAWRATRAPSGRRLADAFVVIQFALSVILLASAGLLVRSLGNLLSVDPGFNAENVLVGRVTIPWQEKQRDALLTRARLFYPQLAERVRHLPGVQAVGLTSTAPFSNGNNRQIFAIQGREPARGEPKLVASARAVTPEYFRAIGTRLERGRLFDARDADGAPLTAIVDRTLAQRFWADGNAVGHLVRLGDDGPWRTIVGVVGSVRHRDLSGAPDRYVYLPQQQFPSLQMDLVIRTVVEPSSISALVRNEVHALDSSLPFYEVHTLQEAVERSLGTRRITNYLLLAFAIAALLLAAVGIYGVMAVTVRQRFSEFGIRLALGAAPRDVMALVLGHGIRLVLIGVVLGVSGAFALTRYLGTLLFEVRPNDPWIMSAAALTLIAAAIAACYLPARTAITSDPLAALRAQ